MTSPRTHFRPITQQDLLREGSSTANGEGSTPTDTSPLNLNYQRSTSGSLHLEKDIITGSPKKYMVYKNPLDENIMEHRPLYMAHQETSLVPKFEVIKNEKFCQTEEVQGEAVNENICSESLVQEVEKDRMFSYQGCAFEEKLPPIWMNENQQGKVHKNLYDSFDRETSDVPTAHLPKEIIESIDEFYPKFKS